MLAYRSCAQRQEIKLKFKSMYGRVSEDGGAAVLLHVAIDILARILVSPLNVKNFKVFFYNLCRLLNLCVHF